MDYHDSVSGATRPASSPQRSRGRSDANSSSAATAAAAAEEDYNALLMSFYTRSYPSADAFADGAAEMDLKEINDAVTELATEVAALREETEVLGQHAKTVQQRRPAGSANLPSAVVVTSPRDGEPHANDEVSPSGFSPVSNGNNNTETGTAATSRPGGNLGGRRGRSYRRRSLGVVDLFMRVEDKAVLLRQEATRLRAQEEKVTKEAEGVQEALVATVEEAIKRQQELQLEVLHFEREIFGDAEEALPTSTHHYHGNTDHSSGVASAAATATRTRRNPFQETRELTVSAAAAATTADELLRYLELRHTTQVNYLDKLAVQCQAVEQDIARAQQLVRQRRIAGEAFQAVDLEQLRIEHKQFTERMAAKNDELAELKGTSTRTVQQLNQLMGQLNELVGEQARLRRESKNRTEYLARCHKEMTTAAAEATMAESKHLTLTAQQEAVRAPKIEEYMAQKAEEVELEKAVKNWERKVQIAEGQATVVRQQTRRMEARRAAALKYVSDKQQQQQQQRASVAAAVSSASTMVGGTRSLLQQRRQQQHQQQQQSANAKSVVAQSSTTSSPAATTGAPRSATADLTV